MPVLAVWTATDGLLGAIAPVGLALSAGDALVVDLDPGGPAYPGRQSLADLVVDGPRKVDLTPGRGVGVLRNGGISVERSRPVVEALVKAHATVVLRLPPRPAPKDCPWPVVPVRLLVPGGWFDASGPAVFQATPAWETMAAMGVRLPVPSRDTVRAILLGRRPLPRDRWVRAFRSVWGLPWRP